MTKETGIFKSTMQRWFYLFGVQSKVPMAPYYPAPRPCSPSSISPSVRFPFGAVAPPAQEFLALLRHFDANVPEGLDVHLVADNYATYKHPKVTTWLAKRPRCDIHYTPTYAPRIDYVDRSAGFITHGTRH